MYNVKGILPKVFILHGSQFPGFGQVFRRKTYQRFNIEKKGFLINFVLFKEEATWIIISKTTYCALFRKNDYILSRINFEK